MTQPDQTPVAAPVATGQKETTISEMFRHGVHFGHKKSKWNPRMESYIFGVRNNTHIIDLNQTYEHLQKALDYLTKVAARNGTILFVGTRTHAKTLVKKLGEACGMPYVSERWIGGTFTNFEVITRRLEHFRKLENDLTSGALNKYTKREQLEFKREIDTLTFKWGGIKHLNRLPDVLFIVDLKEDAIAMREAKDRKIPIVALTDTNTDPTLADYAVPANDDSISSLTFLLGEVQKAVLAGKAQAPAKVVKDVANPVSRILKPVTHSPKPVS